MIYTQVNFNNAVLNNADLRKTNLTYTEFDTAVKENIKYSKAEILFSTFLYKTKNRLFKRFFKTF